MEKGQRGSLRQLHPLVDWQVVGSAGMAELTRCPYSCYLSFSRLYWGFSEHGGVRVQEDDRKLQGLLRPCLKAMQRDFYCLILDKANQTAR